MIDERTNASQGAKTMREYRIETDSETLWSLKALCGMSGVQIAVTSPNTIAVEPATALLVWDVCSVAGLTAREI